MQTGKVRPDHLEDYELQENQIVWNNDNLCNRTQLTGYQLTQLTQLKWFLIHQNLK